MTYPKKQNFDTNLQELADYAKALAHPARLAIIKFLAEKQTCISGDISNEIPLSRTTVSQHLQELKKYGIIHGEISGINLKYCICGENFAKLKILFEQFLSQITPMENTEC